MFEIIHLAIYSAHDNSIPSNRMIDSVQLELDEEIKVLFALASSKLIRLQTLGQHIPSPPQG